MNIQHIMVIIDPTSETDQPCLRRAEQLARHYPQAQFTLFLCDYIPALDGGLLFNNELLKDARNTFLGHREEYLDSLAQNLRASGHTVNTSAVWGKRFERHILKAIQEQQPDVVLKTGQRHSLLKRLVLSNSDWFLIRYCPTPLWLVKQPDAVLQNICASVDPLHESDKPAALDRKILATARTLADATGAKAQAIHCYNPLPQTLAFDSGLVADYDGYAAQVHQHHADAFGEFAKANDLPVDQRHLLRGYPEQSIPEFVEQNGVNLLVLGAISRSRIENALIGHTAERLLEDVPCDMLVIKPDGFVDPSRPA
ncbi:MAG: universal stress protein [Pseudomonas sp.]